MRDLAVETELMSFRGRYGLTDEKLMSSHALMKLFGTNDSAELRKHIEVACSKLKPERLSHSVRAAFAFEYADSRTIGERYERAAKKFNLLNASTIRNEATNGIKKLAHDLQLVPRPTRVENPSIVRLHTIDRNAIVELKNYLTISCAVTESCGDEQLVIKILKIHSEKSMLVISRSTNLAIDTVSLSFAALAPGGFEVDPFEFFKISTSNYFKSVRVENATGEWALQQSADMRTVSESSAVMGLRFTVHEPFEILPHGIANVRSEVYPQIGLDRFVEMLKLKGYDSGRLSFI